MTGGYVAFFQPKLLSTNIEELKSSSVKWNWFLFYFLTAMGFTLLILYLENLPILVCYIFGLLLLIGCIDAYSGVIPNRLLYIGMAGWFYLLFTDLTNATYLIPAVLVSLLFIGIRWGAGKLWGKPGFGWGDIKLILVLGLLTGWNIFWILYFAILSGGFFSVFKILDKKDNYSSLSFAPHIVIGYMLVEAFLFHHIILSLIALKN
ncbi:prepilin peptidase [Gracilimonas tropica]|uniref:prepilin peptidase n=1 Tax=Gracilimonas tropica TaxID=454600 RepID=UPI001FE1802A|nr:prepilin peptidase [Gracilimonas tropica]